MAKKSKKYKQITETVDNIRLYELDLLLVDVRDLVSRLIESYGEDAYFSGGYHDRWEEAYSFNVRKVRDETEQEYVARTKDESQERIEQENRERDQLTRLIAKYGPP